MSDTVKSTGKQLGGATGKGFVPGDPRINRKGRRPGTGLNQQVREVARAVLAERVQGKDGESYVALVAMLKRFRNLALTGDDSVSLKAGELVLAYAYGKPQASLELTGAVAQTTFAEYSAAMAEERKRLEAEEAERESSELADTSAGGECWR